MNTIHQRVAESVSGCLTRGRGSDDVRLFRELTSTANATPLVLRSYIDLVGTAWFLLAFACACIMVAAAFLAEQVLDRSGVQALTGVTYATVGFCIAGGIAVQWYRLRLWFAVRQGPVAEDRNDCLRSSSQPIVRFRYS